MSDRIEILDAELENVSGGKITYTWDGTQGSIGINGNNTFILLNKDAFGEYYAANKGKISEKQILRDLLAKNIIKRP